MLTQRCQVDKFTPFHNLHIHLTSLSRLYLFLELKTAFKGRRLLTVENIITDATNSLKTIHRCTSSSASKSGKGGGRDELVGSGAISKGIIFSKF
jgi:hypothetical protein